MLTVPPPPSFKNLRNGTQLIAGLSKTTILPDIDFETYSPAGYQWDTRSNKFTSLKGAAKKGLQAVGLARYAEDPDADILCLAFNLKDGTGDHLWEPYLGADSLILEPLFEYIMSGGLIEAWNCSFEWWIWNKIGCRRYRFPPLGIHQLRCAAAKSRAFGLPSALENAGNVLGITNKKQAAIGRKVLYRFSVPRNPTKKDSRTRIYPRELPEEAIQLYEYNRIDILAEAEISSVVPDLTEFELEFWKIDQRINARGVKIDVPTIKNCIKIIEQGYSKYNLELRQLTQNKITSASQTQKLISWLHTNFNIATESLDEEAIDAILKKPIHPTAYRVLKIRQAIASASIKKVYSMLNTSSLVTERIYNLFIYHSARTGRAAGSGVQPQNLPNSGLDLTKCESCGGYFHDTAGCPRCGAIQSKKEIKEWNEHAMEQAIDIINLGSLEVVEHYYGDAFGLISGCLRGLIIAEKGYDLICSDYKAIEAVVLAAIAGEEWRLEVFRTHGRIYEMSASKITGVPFSEFEDHKARTGQHHPLRKTVGKVSELASGYQGWIGAWKQFGADAFFTDDEIKQAVLAWRKESPAIVRLWGGQNRGLYGLEGMAISAVLNPGTVNEVRGIKYQCRGDILYCTLPSGRYIVYHKPRLQRSDRPGQLQLSFEGWNTNPKNGKTGWIRMNTYGGKLTENVVQAVSRDILAYAIVNLEKAGYPVVLHVHDEIVAEVKENEGSVEEFEKIMSTLPNWATDWPVKAIDGYRGKRYRK